MRRDLLIKADEKKKKPSTMDKLVRFTETDRAVRKIVDRGC